MSQSAAPSITLAASVEVTPKQIEKDPELLTRIPPATRTYLVDLGTLDDRAWADVVTTIMRAGLEPVPHIAARRLKSRAQLAARLRAMQDAAGVRDALVIAGGAGAPEGPFASSMDALETGLFGDHGFTRVGVAGHPEGNPDISGDDIAKALDWKQTFAQQSGIDMRLVTQFGFDAEAAIAWAENIKAAGIDLPVHLGVAGPASIKSLLKYAAMCGVRASSAFAFKRGASIASLLTSYSPEPFVAPVEAHVATQTGVTTSEPTTGAPTVERVPPSIQQLHVFPFGGLAETARWLTERGSWDFEARAAMAGLASAPAHGATPYRDTAVPGGAA